MPRVNNIFDHWRWKLGLEWDDKDICWGCGFKTEYLQRCHIIPHSLNGVDEPNNYVLLCKQCHKSL